MTDEQLIAKWKKTHKVTVIPSRDKKPEPYTGKLTPTSIVAKHVSKLSIIPADETVRNYG